VSNGGLPMAKADENWAEDAPEGTVAHVRCPWCDREDVPVPEEGPIVCPRCRGVIH